MKIFWLVSGLILLLMASADVVEAETGQRWCEVTDDYIVVDDKLFNYVKSFTKNKGKRHFLYTVAMVESRMNPYSQRGSSGEFGMMQVMPKTGEFLERLKKQKLDVSTVKDNVYAALFYLDFILEKINKHCPGNMSLDFKVQMAAAAYNGGAGHLSKGCSLESYNALARGYSRKFLKYWNRKYISRSSYEKQNR
ncbi:MAG: transglycosylase SLT domain-containing protein, partial [Thermodesulfobacteriota bacterium]|nr:transglycosylase SLT domain-containing protein [Thermodesulfobacteriota bacterium]